MLALDELRFNNRFTASLPGEDAGDTVSRQVVGACYSRISPAPVSRPKLVAHSSEVGELLGLTSEEIQDAEFVDVFSGNRLLNPPREWTIYSSVGTAPGLYLRRGLWAHRCPAPDAAFENL